MPSTSKLIGIALTGTGFVGVGAGTYYALKSNSESLEKTPVNVPKSKISDLIVASKRTVLISTADSWGIKLDVYEKSFKSLVNLPETGEAGLKKWCQNKLDTKIEISKKDEENSDFKIALNLCTKPTNKEKLIKNSKTLAEAGDWRKQKEAYIAESAVADTDIPTITNKKQATEEQISSWCTENIDKEIEDSEKTYKIAEKWCVKS